MSMYCQIKTEFKNRSALINALIETKNLTPDKIEAHDEPQTLYGFQGDSRKEKANIIIRRQNVGAAANDVGFLKMEDGTYQAIISQFDKTNGYGDKFMASLKGNYAFNVIKTQQESLGRTVNRERVGNKQRITIRNIR